MKKKIFEEVIFERQNAALLKDIKITLTSIEEFIEGFDFNKWITSLILLSL
ncbi:MAG: hypothetical protein ACFFG0_45030 [Candidatus Thorarchaeota archaeon]